MDLRGLREVALLGGMGIGAGASCAPPSELPPLAWHGERVSVGTNLVSEICAGTLATLDRDVDAIEQELGIQSNRQILFWLVDYGYVDEHCGTDALACAGDALVISGPHGFAYRRHELVHALLSASMDVRKPLFGEGLATALGGGQGLDEGCLDDPDCVAAPLDLLLAQSTSEQLGAAGYRAGADLVDGMLRQHGPAAVLAFISNIDPGLTSAQVRDEYNKTFDRDLDQDFEAYKRGRYDVFSIGQLGCDHPLAPTDEAGVRLRATSACDSEQVVNEFTGELNEVSVRWRMVVEPEQAGAWVFSGTFSESSQSLHAIRCEPDPLSRAEDRWELGPWALGAVIASQLDQPVFLDAGSYVVTWVDALDTGGEIDLLVAPPCTFEAQDCPFGEQCTIWNECRPEAADARAIGEACEQADGGPLACASGGRCVNGTCVLECDTTQPCPAGQVCGSTRLCGPACNLLQPACPAGQSCLPTNDFDLAEQGIGQCVLAGDDSMLDACDLRDNTCGLGLVCAELRKASLPTDAPCRAVPELGCCAPQCDPQADEPGCPASLPICDPVLDGISGVCRAPT